MKKPSIIIEYWENETILRGVIEFVPQYRKNGCLCLAHSEFIKLATEGKDQIGREVFRTVIHFGDWNRDMKQKFQKEDTQVIA